MITNLGYDFSNDLTKLPLFSPIMYKKLFFLIGRAIKEGGGRGGDMAVPLREKELSLKTFFSYGEVPTAIQLEEFEYYLKGY